MSREVPFDKNAICDACGSKGAFDFMGDYFCSNCARPQPDEKDTVSTYSPKKPHINSAVVIARLLGTEGYTDFVANQVKRYWMRRSGLTDRQRDSIERLKDSFGQIMAKVSEGERLIIGRYFGLLMKMQFETGLKIGLQAFAQLNGNKIDPEMHSPPLVKEPTTVPLEKYKTVKGDLRKATETIKELREKLKANGSNV